MGIRNDGIGGGGAFVNPGSLPLMGIRNHPTHWLAHDLRCCLTTPHGDQEPGRSVVSRVKTTPHYPSWGSGTKWLALGSPASAISLPLMGIRIKAITADDAGAVRLTTPHGDQEQHPFERSIRDARELTTPHGDQERLGVNITIGVTSELTTPHGDQERHRYLLMMGMSHSSLPLMGIRNRAALRRAPCSRRPHYPSWGSGTRSGAGRMIGSASSLPLMGIRNPPRRRGSRRPPESHYPSWGSGTIGQGHWTFTPAASLPLMGIRNQGRTMEAGRSGVASLPSWGSGTCRQRGGVHPSGHLTTPHGDQEPRRGSADCRGDRPHYPSWGSGTSRRGGLTRDQPILTTPHGDQEPGLMTRPSVRSCTSLPLMGIRNLDVLGLIAVPRHDSLPLMGIRNPPSAWT